MKRIAARISLGAVLVVSCVVAWALLGFAGPAKALPMTITSGTFTAPNGAQQSMAGVPVEFFAPMVLSGSGYDYGAATWSLECQGTQIHGFGSIEYVLSDRYYFTYSGGAVGNGLLADNMGGGAFVQGSYTEDQQSQFRQLVIDHYESVGIHMDILREGPEAQGVYQFWGSLNFIMAPPTASVPEPGALALLGIGLVGLVATRRRA